MSPGGFRGSQSGSCTGGSSRPWAPGRSHWIRAQRELWGAGKAPGRLRVERESRKGRGGSFGSGSAAAGWGGGVPGKGVGVFSGILPFKRSRRCSASDAALPAGAQCLAMQAGKDSPQSGRGMGQGQHGELPFPAFCCSERAFCHPGKGNGLGLPNLCQQSPGDAARWLQQCRGNEQLLPEPSLPHRQLPSSSSHPWDVIPAALSAAPGGLCWEFVLL